MDVAVDRAGNQKTAEITVTRQEPPDTTPPELSVNSPIDGATTDAETIAVNGTVSGHASGHAADIALLKSLRLTAAAR